MTREGAISVLECMAVDLTGCMGGLSKKDPLEDVCRQRLEAINTAQSALRPVSREQVEKVWKGEWEWYDEEIGCPLEGVEREWGWRCSKCKVVLPDDFDVPDNPPAMRFCQWCGAPMTDEAVEMVIERMEALHENRD